MKKITWYQTDELLPTESGHYLVVAEGGILPRVAYCDRLGSGCDWYEVMSAHVARELICECFDDLFGQTIKEKFKLNNSEYIDFLLEKIESRFSGNNKKIFYMIEAKIFSTRVDVDAWCELPEYFGAEDDEYVSNIDAIDLTTAIEPVIKRFLAKHKQLNSTPPWAVTEQ